MEITKEALIERGFSNSSNIFFYPESANIEVWVNIKSGVVEIKGEAKNGWLHFTKVPNCCTIEHVDQLISLFITP